LSIRKGSEGLQFMSICGNDVMGHTLFASTTCIEARVPGTELAYPKVVACQEQLSAASPQNIKTSRASDWPRNVEKERTES
jgi:hypothetical protein